MPDLENSEPLTIEKESEIFFGTYARLPLHVTHAEGLYLYTSDGKKYLDMISGIGVNALGYGNKRILNAIQTQSAKFIHTSNLFMIDSQFQLAEKLIEVSGLSKVFFANSGTEAIEAAMKLSRKWASSRSSEKRKIFSLTNSFHGRTYGAVSLTAKPKYHEGFEPLVPETGYIEFDDIEDLENKVSEKTAAVFVEFIQGEGGIFPVSKAFLDKLEELRNKYDFLVVADEIQAGCGRTGKFFSYMNYDFVPDIVTVAKPLGGGLPLAAIIGNEKVAAALTKGSHGTTFGGNPVACAAGLALIEEIEEKGLLENSLKIGAFFKHKFEELKATYNQIEHVRQMGLMIGVSVKGEAAPYVQKALEKGVILNATNGNVIRLLPPLNLTEQEAQLVVNVLDEVFAEEAKAD